MGAIEVFAEVPHVDVNTRVGGEAFRLKLGGGKRCVVGGAVHWQLQEPSRPPVLVVAAAMQTNGCFFDYWKHVGVDDVTRIKGQNQVGSLL